MIHWLLWIALAVVVWAILSFLEFPATVGLKCNGKVLDDD
jgi:hypothetical protein